MNNAFAKKQNLIDGDQDMIAPPVNENMDNAPDMHHDQQMLQIGDLNEEEMADDIEEDAPLDSELLDIDGDGEADRLQEHEIYPQHCRYRRIRRPRRIRQHSDRLVLVRRRVVLRRRIRRVANLLRIDNFKSKGLALVIYVFDHDSFGRNQTRVISQRLKSR